MKKYFFPPLRTILQHKSIVNHLKRLRRRNILLDWISQKVNILEIPIKLKFSFAKKLHV